jgi:hypothetical protein
MIEPRGRRVLCGAIEDLTPVSTLMFDKECAAAHSAFYGESSEMCRVAVDLAQGAR